MWAAGRGTEALRVLDDLEARSDWDRERFGSYAAGVRALVQGDLAAAYSAYRSAAAHLSDVFAGERAVNIAFWMACAGKMLAAGCLLGSVADTTPFAGGVLAFAQHMSGDSELAEKTARAAMEKGFDDPWTLHAVAHAMYSLGRSAECAEWLVQHRPKLTDCSTFMKTHFEFHLALCLVDLENGRGLAELLKGPLWGGLQPDEQQDYWAATGVLNALWKGELRGLVVEGAEGFAASALSRLTGADPMKSKVFSLCIFRWLGPDARSAWLDEIRRSGHDVFIAVADAVQVAHHGRGDWSTAAEALLPVADRLAELGASPEQREVIEEFVAVALAKAGHPLAGWLEKNRRPSVAWYDGLAQPTKAASQ